MDETEKVSALKCTHDVWMESAMFGRKHAPVKIDTGARVNVMSRHHFLDLGFNMGQLGSSNVMLVSFNQTLVRPLGCFQTNVRIRGKEVPMIFHVVPTCANILVCYRDAVRATLLEPAPCYICPPDFEIDTLSVYTKEVVRLTLRDGAVPRSFAARKVPLAMEDEVRAELQRMVDEGVIVEEKEPSDWCSPLLVRRKPNGKLRVCMDPRYLNSFLKRATYALPEVECVFPRFRGAKYFSKMDMTAGFWQVLLDEDSSKMCTFSTPFGRFRYLRLPFGIAPAPELFHRIVGDVLKGMEGAMHFVDDVLVWGNTQEEHDARLAEVLRRFRDVGFTFNPLKCEFSKPAVMFLGHLVDGQTVRPNPEKVTVIQRFPVPTSADEVRRLLGVATYISKFIPRFSAKTAVLRELLKADAAFVWTPDHQKALELIQRELVNDKVLYIFDPARATQIATDASGSGLGAVLLQGNRPIAYAARSLTAAEKNYSTIEKELLAVVFALKRFHFYTAGRTVEVLTDHQPLLGAAKNVLIRDNPRLDRLFDQIIGYDLGWTYVPGKANYLPDYLSRLPEDCIPPLPMDNVDTTTQPIAYGPVYDAVVRASDSDPVVDFVSQCVRFGWPITRNEFPQFARFLFPYHHTLRTVRGVVVDTQNRVYVPRATQATVLQELHIGHPGATTMMARAKQLFFWQHMHQDVVQYSEQCGMCALHRPRQPSEPLRPRDMPTRPGETIAADFFQIGAKRFLALYDVFSQFPFLWPVRAESASELLQACRAFFQFTGCPRQFWSDQGGAFDSQAFRMFAQSIGMRVCYSSAEYPQSNGAAESAVKILKRLRQVSASENELFRALLYLQNSAKRRHIASPAQIFLGRSLRTPLTANGTQYTVAWRRHLSERENEQEAMKRYYDRTRSQWARDFVCGEKVLVHNVRGKSVPAKVIYKRDERSYLVEFDNGSRSIRNRKFLTFLPRNIVVRQPSATKTLLDPGSLPALQAPTDIDGAARNTEPRIEADQHGSPANASGQAAVTGAPEVETPGPRALASSSGSRSFLPRPNPCSPPRPVIYVTRSGRPVVPTLKGLGK
jgi:transposase InsO family protein